MKRIFTERSDEQEIMDDLLCSGKVVYQTLKELDFINKWLGGNAITINGIDSLLKRKNYKGPITLADLGCGSGDMLKRIAAWGEKKGMNFTLTGIDANPNIIDFAQKNSSQENIQYKTLNVLSDEFKNRSFDVVTATLFLHHFHNGLLVEFLKRLKKQAKIGIIINDLHRHKLAYYSIQLLTRLFSKSTMVKYDAPLSVLRAFSREDWIKILKEAEIDSYVIRWRWAFRWQIIIPTC